MLRTRNLETIDPGATAPVQWRYQNAAKGLLYRPDYEDQPWGSPTGYFVTWPFSKGFEAMFSVDNEGHSKWNQCEHYKLTAEPHSGVVDMNMRSGWPNIYFSDYVNSWYLHCRYPLLSRTLRSAFGGPDRPIKGLTSLYIPDESGLRFVPNPPNLATLLQHAMNDMLPGLRSNLSSINSLYELKDLASVRESAHRAGDTARRVSDFLTRIGSFSGKSFRQVLRNTGDNYLQYKFNIAPLLQDIRAVWTALKRFDADVNRRLRENEKPLTHHYSMALQLLTSSEDNTTEQIFMQENAFGFNPVVNVNRQVIPEASKFHVEMEYSYYYTALQARHALLFGLSDELGINLNPAIIWNAIPWSFAVDWVIKIGPWLDSIKLRQLEPVLNIRKCLWSIKHKRKVILSADYDGQVGIPVSTCEETAYRRVPFMPSSTSVELSGLNSDEYLLGSALYFSRGRRS